MVRDCLGRPIKVGDYVCVAGKEDGAGSSGYRPLKLYFGLIRRITKNGTPMVTPAIGYKDYPVNGEHAMIVDGAPIIEKYPELVIIC